MTIRNFLIQIANFQAVIWSLIYQKLSRSLPTPPQNSISMEAKNKSKMTLELTASTTNCCFCYHSIYWCETEMQQLIYRCFFCSSVTFCMKSFLHYSSNTAQVALRSGVTEIQSHFAMNLTAHTFQFKSPDLILSQGDRALQPLPTNRSVQRVFWVQYSCKIPNYTSGEYNRHFHSLLL